jgi:tetratricopeptide (TPR) repeat protein
VRAVEVGHLARAEAVVAAARARAPHDPAPLAAAATIAHWRLDHDAADALAGAALARDPAHVEARLVAAAVTVLRGEAREAREGVRRLAEVRAALAARPDPEGWIGEDVALAWEAEAWMRLGDRPAASKAATLAMAESLGGSFPAWLLRVLFGLREARAADEPMQARAWTELADQVRPLLDARLAAGLGTIEGVRAALSDVRGRLGGNRTRLATTREGTALARLPLPPSPRALARANGLRLRTRPVDEVLAGFHALQARFPAAPTPHTYEGEVRLWLGRPDEAEPCFRRALDRDPVTTWGWIGLGAARLFQGEADEALAIWAEGVAACGFEGPTLFAYRAEAWRALGDDDRAVADLELAIRRKPRRIATRLLRAVIAAERGEPGVADAARAELRRRLPGLVVDLPALADDDPATAADGLRAALTSMRGNRSSTLVTWFAPDGAGPRFGS